MEIYQTKTNIIPGETFRLVEKIALKIFKEIKGKTRRTPYVRSSYFKKEKIFLNIFWTHLHSKKDRRKRLKLFDCAIDLIKHSRYAPIVTISLKKPGETLYRFIGKTSGGEIFYVQIKEKIKTKRKDLISIFPEK